MTGPAWTDDSWKVSLAVDSRSCGNGPWNQKRVILCRAGLDFKAFSRADRSGEETA